MPISCQKDQFVNGLKGEVPKFKSWIDKNI